MYGDKYARECGLLPRAWQGLFVPRSENRWGHDKLQKPATIEFVEKMNRAHRVGRYAER